MITTFSSPWRRVRRLETEHLARPAEGPASKGLAALCLAVSLLGGAATAATPDPQPAIMQMSGLKIAATIPIAKRADWVAITKKGVWIGSKGPDAVNEIDPKTNRVTTVELPGSPCGGLAADGDTLWVPLCGPVPKLAKVDVKKIALVRVFDIGPPASEGGIAVGAGSVWLITDKTGTLARIDPATGAIVQSVQLSSGSYNPVFSKGRVWVTRFDGAELTVVDAKTLKIVDHVPVGPHPPFVTAGAGAVWTLNQGDGSLNRIDVAGRTPVMSIALQIPGPGGDITYGKGRIWTTLMKKPLTVVDAKRSVVLCQWKGPGGDSLGVGHGSLWLTNLTDGTVSRIMLADLPAECRAK